MIRHSYGYQLPHRGVTRNSGAEFDGYSRLDDGDLNTYWKSNPYLMPNHSQANKTLPTRSGSPSNCQIYRLLPPYVSRGRAICAVYKVQYWFGTNDAIDDPENGEWKDFPDGAINDEGGNGNTFALTRSRCRQVRARADTDLPYLRYPRQGRSPQLRRLRNQRGLFRDAEQQLIPRPVFHVPGQEQTFTYSSSIDPWHQPSDLYVMPIMESGDQVGLDLFYSSGLTRGLLP
jgi:hypothetical protein